jgi:hypothetical protein
MGVIRTDYCPVLPTGATTEKKISFLYDTIIQLWKMHVDDRKEIGLLKTLLNSDIPTKRIVEKISEERIYSKSIVDILCKEMPELTTAFGKIS